MPVWLIAILLLAVASAAAGGGWLLFQKTGPSPERVDEVYATPLDPPMGPLRVFHLGHSLVGRDMPAMLAQLAGTGHEYESQLGWGTSLREHWEPDLSINGFEAENAHPRYRDARDAIGSGQYDAVVLTEMVEIADAVKYHKSGDYLVKWADLARRADPETRIYLYESWHRLDDALGWLNRLDRDLPLYWEDRILLRDLARGDPALGDSAQPIRVIPAGQVLAQFVRRIEAAGGLDNVRSRDDLFARNADGTLDQIHMGDLGAYLVALTHYAVLYHRSPLGLPHELLRADGTPATAPGAQVARLMQQTVWDVVTQYDKTGVTP